VISCRNPQHHRVHHLPYSSFFPTGLPTFEGRHWSREAGVGRHEAWVQRDQLQKSTTSPCPSPSVLFVLPNRLTYVRGAALLAWSWCWTAWGLGTEWSAAETHNITVSITFRTLRSFQPAYLRSSSHACHSTRSPRLSNTDLLSTPFVRTSFGARSFSTAAPKIWNSLPLSLRTTIWYVLQKWAFWYFSHYNLSSHSSKCWQRFKKNSLSGWAVNL